MSEVREGYKVTEIGEIPSEWVINNLDELVVKITDGAHKTPKYTERGIPFLRVTDIQSKEIDWNNTKYISKEEHEELIKRCHPEKGDLLLSKNGTIGLLKQVDWEEEFSIFVSLCLIKLKKKDSLLDAKFLLHYLSSEVAQKQFKDSSKQGTVTNLHLTEIKKCKIPVLNINEQQKIASILSTVDEQIDETKKLIVKTKELKRGLMQQLLTKGIGHTEFKQTELGEIPSEWQFSNFDTIFELIDGDRSKKYPSPNEIVESGVLFLSTANIKNQKLNLNDIKFITQEKFDSLSKGKLVYNDLIITLRGTLGAIALFNNERFKTGFINAQMMILRSLKEVNPKFAYYYLTSELTKQQINLATSGSAQPQLTKRELKLFKLGLPTLEEQKKIASILSIVDEQVEDYEQERVKYEELKKGLMQQLLTGQIRVKI